MGRKVTLSLFLLDTVAVALVFNGFAWLRLSTAGAKFEIIHWPLLVPWVFLVGALHLIDGYRTRSDKLSLDYASTHAIAVLAAMAGTLLITFVLVTGHGNYSLQQSRAAVIMSFILLLPITLGYRRALHGLLARAHRERSLVFIGDRASREIFRADCERLGMKQNVIYAFPREDDSGDGTRTPLLALPNILADIRSGDLAVEAIVLRESNRALDTETSQQLVDLYFSGVPTYTLELFHQVYWRKIPLYRLNQTWLFQEGFRVAREPVFERLKRLSDIGFSIAGLTLGAPLIALAGIAVWLEDRGPIFFRQTRIGRHRRPFRICKIRSMRAERAGPRYTQAGDTRITRVGRFLRASRIDEIPQLWNVLRGEMSLIGPRAEWDLLVNDYERQIACYHFRHLVRPGITGWAQVNYPYGANLDDTLRKLEYDLYYIRHYSFTLDASIILKTIHVMLFGRGR